MIQVKLLLNNKKYKNKQVIKETMNNLKKNMQKMLLRN